MIRQIVVTLPVIKETRKGVKYGTDDWDGATVPGHIYPLKTALASAFGKFPTKIKVTIEDASEES